MCFSINLKFIDFQAIDSVWNTVDKQIIEHELKAKSKEKKKTNSNTYKVIRVFISSTFTDFYSEREILVKNALAELREWCANRNLGLIECDLRWGVTSDSTTDQTILTCLNEIDRCHEENDGQPFFVGLLSEKYGWVPGRKTNLIYNFFS